MQRLRRPTDGQIATVLSSAQPFSYREVGATRALGAAPSSPVGAQYDFDHHEFPIGRGRALFARARASLAGWRHLEIPWLELHGARDPAAADQPVATLVRVSGVWFLNPCRVVYTDLDGDPDRAAFAYGTLPGHPERGEERFEVTIDPESDQVHYRISAFSRPAVLLSRLGYPFARRLQRRFARSSAAAIARAVG